MGTEIRIRPVPRVTTKADWLGLAGYLVTILVLLIDRSPLAEGIAIGTLCLATYAMGYARGRRS